MTEPIKTEVVYETIEHVALRLHVFKSSVPSSQDESAPVMVIFHGGGWVAGRPEQFFPLARHFALDGFVTVCADYRVRNVHGTSPFESMTDARSAIRWVRQHAEALQVDPNRLIAVGGSAGGHLALCAAVFPHPEEEQATSFSCIPNGLILFNPVVDTTSLGFGEQAFAGRSMEASPVHHIRCGLPDTLILHGTEDTIVPIENVRRLDAEMTSHGNRCLLVEYPGQIHGFFNYRNGDNSYYTVTLEQAGKFARQVTDRLSEKREHEIGK